MLKHSCNTDWKYYLYKTEFSNSRAWCISHVFESSLMSMGKKLFCFSEFLPVLIRFIPGFCIFFNSLLNDSPLKHFILQLFAFILFYIEPQPC